MKDFNQAFLERALELAGIAEFQGEVPVGAVVVHNQKIIGEGYNEKETFQNPVLHAEISALIKASETIGSWRLSECELYVTLEPCPMCLGACVQSRIKKIYYGAKDPKGGALSLGFNLNQDSRLNHRFEAHYCAHQECGLILSRFFKNKRLCGHET